MTRSFRLCALSSATALWLAASAPATAAGVLAGTLIENTASAEFQAGGVPQSVDSNTVSVRVDELLDVTTASLDGAAIPVTGSAILSFSVSNTGNGPEAFVLTADPAVAGNDFDATIDGLAIDANGNGVYDAGVDTLIANGATSPALTPDVSFTVFVLVTSPGSAADGDTSQVQLRAQAATGNGAPGTVFSGAGEGGGAAVVGTSGADDQALGTLVSAKASVTLTKSAVVADPFGGTQAVPGATIRYTITASASGTGSVSGLRVSDSFPAGTSYTAGSLALQGVALTDLSDADAGVADATGISVQLGSLAAGESRAITFDVTIDS